MSEHFEYYTEFNKPEIKPTPSGTKLIDKYELKIKDGIKELVKTNEKRNIYTLKQEALEETKIYNILKRHAMGDETALNMKKGIYLDLTTMPKTLLDAENAILKAQSMFEALPIEERTKYNQNWREWLTTINKITETKQVEQQKSYINNLTPNQEQTLKQTTTTETTAGGNE